MYDLNTVFKDGLQDIQERMNIITNTIEDIMKLQSDLQEQGCWCPQCQRWYYKNDCDLQEKTFTKLVCANPFQGYLDSYKYEECIVHKWYDICPKGHQISDKERFQL